MVSRARWARALVTGGSAGIGACFAGTLAAAGTDLVLVARRKDRLDELAAELRDRYAIEVEILPADLSERPGIRTVEERIETDDDPIDLVVNNAGGSEPNGRGPFGDVDRGVLEGQIMLNAVAVTLLTHAAVTAMRRRGGGRVIQVSSGVAFFPVPGGSVYAASKAFTNSLSEAVDYELRGSGVGVTVVCPGFTRTEAPSRIGIEERDLPGWMWIEPQQVVDTALAGAARGASVCSPALANKLNARIGRHFPGLMKRAAARMLRIGS